MSKNQKPCVAAIMAHSDDLELLCGGTFAKLISEGWHGVYGVLSACNSGYCVIDGEHTHRPSEGVMPKRRAEAMSAAELFGAEFFQMDLMEGLLTDSNGNRVFLEFPKQGYQGENPPPGGPPLATAAFSGLVGNDIPGSPVHKVADLLIDKCPEMVFCQCVDNTNPDHFAAALIVYKAWLIAAEKVQLGPLYLPLNHKSFYPMKPDWISDVSGFEKLVEEAICKHESQGGEIFLPILRDRWKLWGEQSGVVSGEPFIKLLG